MPRPKNWWKKEKFVKIDGYGGKYSISNMGRIRRDKKDGRRLGYIAIDKDKGRAQLIDLDGSYRLFSVANLVAKYHLGLDQKRVMRRDPSIRDYSVFNIDRGDWGNRSLFLENKTVIEIKEKLVQAQKKLGIYRQLAKEYSVSKDMIRHIDIGLKRRELCLEGEKDLKCLTCGDNIHAYSHYLEHKEECGSEDPSMWIRKLKRDLSLALPRWRRK